MVHLSRIYTRTGDDGTTGLGDGGQRKMHDPRIRPGYECFSEARPGRDALVLPEALPALRAPRRTPRHMLFIP